MAAATTCSHASRGPHVSHVAFRPPTRCRRGRLVAGGWSPAIKASVCRLKYSAPYVFDGFGLLSLAPAQHSLASYANSPAIINVGMFLLVSIFLVGWLAYGVEWLAGRQTSGTVGRWIYWSITAFSGVGFGGACGVSARLALTPANAPSARADVVPLSRLGRLLSGVWMLACVLFTSVFTSLLTSSVTAGALGVTSRGVDVLEGVRGTLCITTAYPRLQSFINAAVAGRSDVRVVKDEAWACAERVRTGDVAAATAANGSSLRTTINPALIATVVDPTWTPAVSALLSRYTPALANKQSTNTAAGAKDPASDKVNRALMATALTVVGVSIAIFMCGDPARRAVRRCRRGGATENDEEDHESHHHEQTRLHARALGILFKVLHRMRHSEARLRRDNSTVRTGAAGAADAKALSAGAAASQLQALDEAMEALQRAAACVEQLRGAVPGAVP